MLSILQIILMILSIIQWIVLAHVIMSWLVQFQVVNLRQPLVAQIWFGLNRILEPLYRPIRNMLPAMGGIDLAPLVLLVAIFAARTIIVNNAGLFV